jgi:hypothetical protein
MWWWKMALLSLLSRTFYSAKAWTTTSASHALSTRHVHPYAPLTASFSKLSAAAIGTPATAFDDGVSPFQITTPIYYVNDKPHIGHAYTSDCSIHALVRPGGLLSVGYG